MSNWEAPSAGQLLPLQRTLTLHWGAQFLPRGWERLHGGCPDDEAAGNWEGGPRCLRAEGWAVPGVGEGGPREVTPGLTKMTVTSLGRRRWLGQGQEDSTSPSGLCGRSSGVGVPIIAYSSLGLAACLRERTPQLGDPRHGARVPTTSRHCTEWGAPDQHRTLGHQLVGLCALL